LKGPVIEVPDSEEITVVVKPEDMQDEADPKPPLLPSPFDESVASMTRVYQSTRY